MINRQLRGPGPFPTFSPSARLRTVKIITVTNNKGGVGKTHTVFHLSGAYAAAGRRILAVDLDPQQNLSKLFFGKADRPQPTIFEVLADADAPLARAVYPTAFPEIRAVPSHDRMENLDALLLREPDTDSRLADALDEYLGTVDAPDCVLIDCPPGLQAPTRNALAAAHQVVVPIEADDFSVDGLERLLDAIVRTKSRQNPQLTLAGILVSKYKRERSLQQAFDEAVRSQSLPVFQTRIKDAANYQEAIKQRRPITHFRPRSEHAEAFRSLVRELDHVDAHQG